LGAVLKFVGPVVPRGFHKKSPARLTYGATFGLPGRRSRPRTTARRAERPFAGPRTPRPRGRSGGRWPPLERPVRTTAEGRAHRAGRPYALPPAGGRRASGTPRFSVAEGPPCGTPLSSTAETLRPFPKGRPTWCHTGRHRGGARPPVRVTRFWPVRPLSGGAARCYREAETARRGRRQGGSSRDALGRGRRARAPHRHVADQAAVRPEGVHRRGRAAAAGPPGRLRPLPSRPLGGAGRAPGGRGRPRPGRPHPPGGLGGGRPQDRARSAVPSVAVV